MIPLEIIGHREVRLKLLITAVEVLFQGGTEDKRDSWEAFSNADISRMSPVVAIFEVDLSLVSHADRPILRKDERHWW